MSIVCREPSVWRAAGPCFILLGLITLLLLPATARGQSAWRPGVPQPMPPGASEVSRLNLAPPDLRLPAPGRENPGEDPGKPSVRQALPKDLGKAADYVRNSGRHLASRPVASRPASGFHRNLPIEPATSGWLPSQCPLPPASVFFLQTNFRKYLETWPTPGSTATEAWPEYIPEDEEDLD
jgi:hypothetical protein